MALRKRTEITVETHEVLIVRSGDSSVRMWCPKCNTESRMIGLDEAVTLVGVCAGAIMEMIAATDVHCVQQDSPMPLICLTSLFERLAGKQGEPP